MFNVSPFDINSKIILSFFQRGPRRKPYTSKTAKELAHYQMTKQKRVFPKKGDELVDGKSPQEVYRCVPCKKVFYKKNYLRKHDSRFHKVILINFRIFVIVATRGFFRWKKAAKNVARCFCFFETLKSMRHRNLVMVGFT